MRRKKESPAGEIAEKTIANEIHPGKYFQVNFKKTGRNLHSLPEEVGKNFPV